jgi:hypothetical protein
MTASTTLKSGGLTVARKKKDSKKFRRERANELQQFAQLLLESQVVSEHDDLYPLYNAAQMCRNSTPKGPDYYGYDLNRLLFQIETPRHTLPRNVGDSLVLELSVTLKGICEVETDDPFKYELSVDIEISASNSSPRKYLCAWHLDRHIMGEEDSEPHEVHPLYHFQYGGKNMYHIDNLGNVLLLDPPRLAHPPMDAILAIDFVLSNFAGAVWNKLRDDSVYRNIVADAQKRFWLPYFKSIVAQWGTTPERKACNARLLLPNLF